MKKIIVNGKYITVEEFVDMFKLADEGNVEYDFDQLGALLDADTLTKAIDSFTTSYTMRELIEKYLEIALNPIVHYYPEFPEDEGGTT